MLAKSFLFTLTEVIDPTTTTPDPVTLGQCTSSDFKTCEISISTNLVQPPSSSATSSTPHPSPIPCTDCEVTSPPSSSGGSNAVYLIVGVASGAALLLLPVFSVLGVICFRNRTRLMKINNDYQDNPTYASPGKNDVFN